MRRIYLPLALVASLATAKDKDSPYVTPPNMPRDSVKTSSVTGTKQGETLAAKKAAEEAKKAAEEAKKACLKAGGMFQICTDFETGKSSTAQSGKGFSEPFVSPYMKLAVDGMEKVIVKRAQAEAFDWIVANAISDTSDSRKVKDVFPKTLDAAMSPGYRGVRANLLAIRTGFRNDLADIASNPEKIYPLLQPLDPSITVEEWRAIHSLLQQAQVVGYSGGQMAAVMGFSGDTSRASLLNAILLSWQKDPQGLQSTLMNQGNLKLVLDNINGLLPEQSQVDPQKLVQFLIHLDASSDLFRLRGDSAIRALPTVVALVQEGLEALGANDTTMRTGLKKAAILAKAANLLMDRNVPGAARQLFALKYPETIPAKLEAFLGLLDALSESDTLAVATALDQIIAPAGGWKGKYDGLTHFSLSSFAGIGGGAYFPTLNSPEGIYGPQIPIGVEWGWKDPSCILPSSIVASFLNLGNLMNVRGEEVQWEWRDVAAPGAFLKWQLGRSPFVLLLGGEYRRNTWSTLGSLGIDVTLFPIR